MRVMSGVCAFDSRRGRWTILYALTFEGTVVTVTLASLQLCQ